MIKKIWNPIVVPLIVAAITGICSLVYRHFEESNETAKRCFDKYITISQIHIKEAELSKAQLKLLYKNVPLSDYSEVTVQLFNYTGHDFGHVPIYIQILPDDGDSLKLINADVSGEDGLKEAVKTIEDTTNGMSDGIKLGYEMIAANHADSIGKRIFQSTYLILSKKKPKVNVYLIKPGLDVKNYDQTDFSNTPFYLSTVAVITYGIIIFIFYIVILIKISNYIDAKRTRKLNEFIRTELAKMINNNEMKIDSAETLQNQYQGIIKKYNDTHPSWITSFFKSK